MNCPFYGRAMFVNAVPPPQILLLDTRGNQCALVTSAHSPCMMQMDGQMADWGSCPRVREIRMEPPE